MTTKLAMSLKSMIRNRKAKNLLFEVFIVLAYILSLFIYHESWTKLIDFIWVNPIACRFDASLQWLVAYCFILVVVLVYYVITFFNERTYSLFRICLVSLIVSLYLMYAANSIFDIFGLVIIGELFLFELIVSLKIYFSENKSGENNSKGLDFEQPILRTKEQILNGKETYGRTDYIISTHSLLKNTFDSKSAFAVGISGKWGSGKTSFTNDLKTLLKDDVDIVLEFKPWFCKSPNEIIEDFFNEYRYNISTFIPGLNAKLKFYMDALQNVEIHNSNFKLSFKNFMHQKSSGRIYSEVIETLIKANVKVVIIIDDLDRLDKDEILEVLRLIRNTANFPYTQFIVTYDKDYVLKTLSQNLKVNYNDFLMKIFNLEIALPSFENILLCRELEKQIADVFDKLNFNYPKYLLHNMTHIKTEIENAKLRLDIQGDEDTEFNNSSSTLDDYFMSEYKIPLILKSMRDIIRFSNSFRLNLFSIQNKIQSEIVISDFFYLELLRYRFTSLYYVLRENPLILLYFNENRYQVDSPFHVAIEPQSNKAFVELDSFISDKKDKSLALFILEQLFDSKIKSEYNSITNVSNYFTYFASRIDSKNISLPEFLKIIPMQQEEAFDKLINWFKNNEKNRGQIEEKLSVCLARTFPNEKKPADIDYKYLYGLIRFFLEKSDLFELSLEIYNSVLQHFSRQNNLITRIGWMQSEQYNSFVEFWIYFFDYIEEKDKEINKYILKYIFEGCKGLTNDIVLIISNDTKSISISTCIHDYLNDYSMPVKSRTVPDPNSIDSILIIQFNRLKNYFSEIRNIDKRFLGLYNSAYSSLKLLNNKGLVREIRNYFVESIEMYPLSFIESNMKIEVGDILFEIPIKNIYEKNDLARLGKIISETKYDKTEKVKRVRNFWTLISNNDFEPLAFRNYDIYKSITSDYDFESDIADLNQLQRIKQKLIEARRESDSNIGFEKNLRIKEVKNKLGLEFREMKIKFGTSPYYEVIEMLEKEI